MGLDSKTRTGGSRQVGIKSDKPLKGPVSWKKMQVLNRTGAGTNEGKSQKPGATADKR